MSCAAMACLAFLPFEAHAASKSDLDHKKWWAWVEIGGFYDSEYDGEAEVELFFPIAQSAYSLLFLDVEGELFANDMQDGAVALGYRQMFSNGWNLGLWAGPEVRRTDGGNRFWRFDAGLELLHPDYDFRFNAYAPFTHAQAASPAIFAGAAHQPGEVVLDGNEIFMWGDLIGNGAGAEVPLWGFDGEVGVRVPLEMAGVDPNNAELRLYGGGFYFDASEAMEEIAGPKARAELRFYDVIPGLTGSRLTADYEYSYDDVRGDRHKAGARFRIPSGNPTSLASLPSSGQPLTCQERRMLDGLEREDIFTTRGKLEREAVGDYLTGVVFDRVAYVDTGDDLSNVSNASGANTLIIVNGTLVTTETEDLQGVQTVQGGGSTIPVFGVRSGRVADFTAPGAEAFIDNTVFGHVLALQGNHTHIAGLDIDGNGTGGQGINVGDGKNAAPIGPGTWNIVIDQTDVHDVNWGGIVLGDDNANVLIFNETTVTNADFGIFALDNNTNVQITGVDVSNINRDGIFFNFQNSNIMISETTVADVGWAGIGFQQSNEDIHITGVNISNPALEGIHLRTGNANVVISEATIVGAGTDGIMNYENNTAVRITNSTITAGNVGISLGQEPGEDRFNGGGNDVTIENTTINSAGVAGLLVTGVDPNTITITATTFTGDFSDEVIDIGIAGNTLSGDGNVFDGTKDGSFCEVTGAQTGSFGFDIGPNGNNGGGPATTCP